MTNLLFLGRVNRYGPKPSVFDSTILRPSIPGRNVWKRPIDKGVTIMFKRVDHLEIVPKKNAEKTIDFYVNILGVI